MYIAFYIIHLGYNGNADAVLPSKKQIFNAPRTSSIKNNGFVAHQKGVVGIEGAA